MILYSWVDATAVSCILKVSTQIQPKLARRIHAEKYPTSKRLLILIINTWITGIQCPLHKKVLRCSQTHWLSSCIVISRFVLLSTTLEDPYTPTLWVQQTLFLTVIYYLHNSKQRCWLLLDILPHCIVCIDHLHVFVGSFFEFLKNKKSLSCCSKKSPPFFGSRRTHAPFFLKYWAHSLFKISLQTPLFPE